MKKFISLISIMMVLVMPFSVLAEDPVNPGTGDNPPVTDPALPQQPPAQNEQNNQNNQGNQGNQNNQNSNTQNFYKQTYEKSNDANLGLLEVDGQSIPISNEMYFETGNATPSIVAKPSSNKASIKIDKPDKLSFGDNIIKITVTAENFYVVKEYTLNLKLVSTDATISSLKIDGKYVKVSDEMSVRTDKKKLDIKVKTANDKASVNIENNDNLKLGKNKIIIKVTAEDGKTTQDYVINVTRVNKLIGDVGITVWVNNEKVTFKKYKSNIIYINNDVSKINIKYKLSDKYAEIDLKYDKNIEVGNKTIKFKVTAENGKVQEYELYIHRFSVFEEVLASGLGVIIFGIIIIIIYHFVTKFKKASRRKIYKFSKFD